MTHQHGTGGLKTAFFLNLAFAIFEALGGLWINSMAVVSDALHDLGDSFSIGLAWFLSNYSQKKSDQRYTYGYRRYSLLGALINALILIVGSLFILSEAIPRLQDPESFNEQGMIVFALVGITMNGIAAWRLRGSESTSTRVISWHLLEDVLGWVGVLIVGLVSLFVDVPILDPILSILIMLYILFNVFGNLKDAAEMFLQAAPENINLDEVKQRLLSIDGVLDIHHMHIWSLDGEHNVFTIHLVVDENTPSDKVIQIKSDARAAVEALDLEHLTIEIDYGREDGSPYHTS